jgi:hypothetical protein
MIEHAAVSLLRSSVPHPGVTDLIFGSEREMVDEEIVDAAVNYPAFPLGATPCSDPGGIE